MFLFIPVCFWCYPLYRQFKYISCFYLSITIVCLCWKKKNLNTSHVFIYPCFPNCRTFPNNLFKYISCFYLSLPALKRSPRSLFKYISCFYLSSVFTPFPFYIITNFPLFFNVSSVFYQPPSLLFLSTFIFFFSPYFISFFTFFLCTTPGNLEYQTLSIFYHPVSQDFLSKNIVIY